MLIGIHAKAIGKKDKTGVEKYADRLISSISMLPEAKEHRFVLYTDKEVSGQLKLSANVFIKILQFPYLWTQLRLGLHLIFSRPNALFVPAHVLPILAHPKNSTVMIHDIAFELFPQTYPKFHRAYLRFTTKYALKHAKKILVPSKNTFHDLMKFYKVDSRKIFVVPHGIDADADSHASGKLNFPYFLYIGRLELKKNILGILKAFDMFKAEHRTHHKLVLAGGFGFGREAILDAVSKHRFKNDIVLAGWVDESEKKSLLSGADIFLFPSLYEGFGFPILEAQAYGIPLVTSCISSMPEVAGDGAIFVNPHNPEEIKDAIARILKNVELRDGLISKGKENLKNFSWQKCARKTLEIITS